jgi:uncharacterized protein (DUF736 family)
MAIIGTFTRTAASFIGSINTLTVNTQARLVPIDQPSDKGPHFRVFAGKAEIGAAWERAASETGQIYLSIKLDDPSFAAPIFANLIQSEEDGIHQLIWSRPNRA